MCYKAGRKECRESCSNTSSDLLQQITANNILHVIQFVRLYSSESVYVWIYDGNMQHLFGKHIPLFITAVVLLVLLLAYAFVLVSFSACKIGEI